MNIFDIIDSIAFSKKQDLNQQAEDEKIYQPYLVNRWLSMLDGNAAKIINDTVNRYGHVFSSAEHHRFLSNVLPKYRKQRIQYIKKPSKDKT